MAIKHLSQRKRILIKGGWERVKDYVSSFLEETTIHGLRHLISRNHHPVESMLWLAVVIAAVIGAVSLIMSSWNRYSANPTVVSLEKDYRNWKIAFPATTFCYLERLNEMAALEYVNRTWGIGDESKVNYYMRFLGAVANISLENLYSFSEFKDDDSLQKVDLEQLLYDLQVDLKSNVTLEYNNVPEPNRVTTLTELGLCHTSQSAVSHHFSVTPLAQAFKEPTTCIVGSFCSAHVDIKDGLLGLQYGTHSPYEIADVNTRMYQVQKHWDHKTNYVYVTIVAAKTLRNDLNPTQRRCRFADEVDGLPGLPFYSYNLCSMRCRQKLASKLCGCAPFFYKSFGGFGPSCNVTGLACVADHVNRLIHETSCGCLPLCEEFIYYANLISLDKRSGQSDKIMVGSVQFPTIATWRLLELTKYRLNRDIVFSFADLLVSFGGTAALFLGCSLLSGVELIYFFTLRLVAFVVQTYEQRNGSTHKSIANNARS